MNTGVLFEQPLWLFLFLLIPPVLLWTWRGSRVRISPRRARVVRALRLLILLLLVLALAGLTAWKTTDTLTVVFAVDTSRSLDLEARQRIAAYLEEAAGALPPGDRAAVIAFGRDAMVDTSPQSEWRASEVLARPDPDGTNLEAAVRLASALFPPGHERRVVLLSDGVETLGSVEDAVLSLKDPPDLVWLPMQSAPAAEVLVEQVSAPEHVQEGEPHRVRVVARSSRETEAVLRVYRGSTPVAASRIRLQPDKPNVYSFEQSIPPGSGIALYRARIEAEGDGTLENNRASTLVQVRGQPRVLLVDERPEDLTPLRSALEAAGMKVAVAGPAGVPADGLGLASWDALLLSDTPSTYFSDGQLEGIRTWVEAFGGGFLMTGGPGSFGPGGYWKTPVEEVLPVNMEVKDRSFYPSLGLVLCIDKSGSMGGGQTESKIEVAKAAAAEVARNMLPMDRLGVVAFDAAAKWVVPLTPGGNPDEIIERIGSLVAGGGTDGYPALEQARQALVREDVRVKHVLLLTDGQMAVRDYEGLISGMREDRLTVSTVAIGTDADMATLEWIAQLGDGRFYIAEDIDLLPRIFMREAFHVARSWIEETPFVPKLRGTHPALAGLELSATPPLGGYVGTSEKAAARHPLGTPRGDPLLSLWRTGLGKSVAFTSDPKSRWGAQWLGWSGYGPFWARLFRWSLRDPAAQQLRVATETSSGRLHVTADVFDDNGAFVNSADVRGLVIGPEGLRKEISLQQAGPGRYEAVVDATVPGPYLAAVYRRDSAGETEGATSAAVVPYSDEFRTLGRSADGMERLVASGRARRANGAETLFEHRGTGGRVRWPLAPWLVALAALFLILEVAARKMRNPFDVLSQVRVRSTPESQPAFSALQAARARAERRIQSTAGLELSPDAEGSAPEPERIEAPETREEAPPPPKPPANEEQEGAATTSRLLAARRKRRTK